MNDSNPEATREGFSARRLIPVFIAAAGAILLYVFGREYLSFDALKDNREALSAWRDANYLVAALTYMAIYAAAVALSFPGGLALTLAGGFLFGTIFGGLFAVTGASIGAITIFFVAKTGLGDVLRARAGKWVKKAEDSFRANEVSFLLIMRLVPAIPFFAANLVPAFLGASPVKYAWTTFIGIMPGAFVYASVGAGLSAVFARGETPNLGIIFEIQVLGPLLGLAALSALPILIKKFRGKKEIVE